MGVFPLDMDKRPFIATVAIVPTLVTQLGLAVWLYHWGTMLPAYELAKAKELHWSASQAVGILTLHLAFSPFVIAGGSAIANASSLEEYIEVWCRTATRNLLLLPLGCILVGWLISISFGFEAGLSSTSFAYLAYFLLRRVRKENLTQTPSTNVIRGSRLLDQPRSRIASAVKRWGGRAPKETEPKMGELFFGGHLVTIKQPHFLFTGISRSGKSMSISMLLRSYLEGYGKGSPIQMAALDAKYETYPELVGIGIPEESISLLNPFDARGVAWDIAADVIDEPSADQIAGALIQGDKNEKPVWYEVPRALVSAAMQVFNHVAPGRWSLNDLVQLFRSCSEEERKQFYSQLPLARSCYETNIEAHPETAANFRIMLDTYMRALAVPAALWTKSDPKRSVSLRKWVKGREGVVVFAIDESREVNLGPVNRSMLHFMMTQLAQREKRNPLTECTWMLFDELGAAGRLEKLARFLEQAGSKGVRVIIGTQGLEGLYDVYGKSEGVDALTGQCSSVATLRLQGPKSRKWASDLLGEQEVWQRSTSVTQGPQGESAGTSHSIQRVQTVLPSDFAGLPPTTPETGLAGYYSTTEHGIWKSILCGEEVEARRASDNGVEGFVERPIVESSECSWSAADKLRFGAIVSPDDVEPPDTTPSEPDDPDSSTSRRARRNTIRRMDDGQQ